MFSEFNLGLCEMSRLLSPSQYKQLRYFNLGFLLRSISEILVKGNCKSSSSGLLLKSRLDRFMLLPHIRVLSLVFLSLTVFLVKKSREPCK